MSGKRGVRPPRTARLRGGIVLCCAHMALGCGSYPCGWTTTAYERTPTEGIALTCDAATFPVIARYENAVSPATGNGSLLSLAFIAVGFATDERLHFSAALADGTYPIDTMTLWADTRATGSLSFTRSRDVPLADIADPAARDYTSTIDFELSALLTDSGCSLKTDGQLHLEQSGPLLECERGKLGGWH